MFLVFSQFLWFSACLSEHNCNIGSIISACFQLFHTLAAVINWARSMNFMQYLVRPLKPSKIACCGESSADAEVSQTKLKTRKTGLIVEPQEQPLFLKYSVTSHKSPGWKRKKPGQGAFFHGINGQYEKNVFKKYNSELRFNHSLIFWFGCPFNFIGSDLEHDMTKNMTATFLKFCIRATTFPVTRLEGTIFEPWEQKFWKRKSGLNQVGYLHMNVSKSPHLNASLNSFRFDLTPSTLCR